MHLNTSRLLLAGLVAGLVINVFEFVLNAIVLEAQWREVMLSLNRPGDITTMQIVWFNVMGFALGVALVWLYASLRPRYPASRPAAITAGLALWMIGYVLPSIPPLNMGIFPSSLIAIALVWGLVELLVASCVGAAVYKETPAPQTASTAA